MERAPADAELFGGAAAVAAALVQGAFDEDALVLLQVAGGRGEDVARDAGRGGFADVHGDVFESDLAGAAESESELPARANVLLEDLSNLLANEMFHPKGGGIDAVRAGIIVLKNRCENLTVVTNELFSDGGRYDGMTELYLRNLAMLNRELAREADLVTEVVCGLPNVLKGNLP